MFTDNSVVIVELEGGGRGYGRVNGDRKENKGKNIYHHSNPSISAGLNNWGYS